MFYSLTAWLRLLLLTALVLLIHFLTSSPTVNVNLHVGTETPPPTLLYGSQGGPYSSADHNWPPGNWQPYAADSFWNTELPAYNDPNIHLYNGGAGDTNADIINYLTNSASWPTTWSGWDISNTTANDTPSSWNQPVYFAKSTDPLYTINTTVNTCQQPQATFCPTKLRIPDGAMHARPTVVGSGTDGSMTVIEPAGFYSVGGTDPQGRPANEVDEVDFYQVQNSGTNSGFGATGAANATPCNPNCVIYNHGSGALNFDGNGCCGNANATNTGLIGGIVRPQELAAGVIHHALNASVRCNTGKVAPGVGPGAGHVCATYNPPGPGPPDGARLQLKLSDATIDGMAIPLIQKIYLKAAAHYGLFVTDTGGSPVDTKFEPAIMYTQFESSSLTISSWLQTPEGGGFGDPYTFRPNLPWSDWQVLDPCYSTTPPTC